VNTHHTQYRKEIPMNAIPTLSSIDHDAELEDARWEAYCTAARQLDRDDLCSELLDALADGSKGDPLEELFDTLLDEPEYDPTHPSYPPVLIERLGRLVYRRACEVVNTMTEKSMARQANVDF
jgi:hypothetical protein